MEDLLWFVLTVIDFYIVATTVLFVIISVTIRKNNREKLSKTGLVTEYCRNCAFAAIDDDTHAPEACGYFIITGKQRPCPAGEGCTVRKRARIEVRE